jgi:hypothetical protein
MIAIADSAVEGRPGEARLASACLDRRVTKA